jgi:hypothetical protein
VLFVLPNLEGGNSLRTFLFDQPFLSGRQYIFDAVPLGLYAPEYVSGQFRDTALSCQVKRAASTCDVSRRPCRVEEAVRLRPFHAVHHDMVQELTWGGCSSDVSTGSALKQPSSRIMSDFGGQWKELAKLSHFFFQSPHQLPPSPFFEPELYKHGTRSIFGLSCFSPILKGPDRASSVGYSFK